MGQGLDLVRAGLDGGLLEIKSGLVRVSLDKTYVIEQELVAAGSTELGITEKNADLGRRPVRVVGVDLDDHGNLVRCIALEGDVVDDRLLPADACALVDRPVNDVFGNTLGTGFFKRGEESGVRCRIRASLSGGDGDFPDELARRLGLLE